jgi:NAD(P)-dependent dehydrogenase (short-subunit alcohol dehydrogenase family)
MKQLIFYKKVAVITGSSRGIGKAIAMALAHEGAFIVLNGRNMDRLQEAENEVQQIQKQVHSVCCDVATIEGGQQLIDEAVDKYGRIDILVNNVGVSMRGYLADLNPAVFSTIFDSNILGVINPSIPAIPFLRATKGSILFISSLAGIRGLPGLSAYCASKMALRALAESIRIEEAAHNIHVGLIYVSYTENDPGKETIAADGTKKILASRNGNGAQTKDSVARAVVRNIKHRKYISVLTAMGKLNAFLQAFSPLLVEKIILKNLKKFEDHLR